MIREYAEIENSIVQNVIIAGEEFISTLTGTYVPCAVDMTIEPDDTKIARIGEAYLDGKFINGNQAVELGLMTKEEALVFGFHSGHEYKVTLEDELNELKAKILVLKPDVTFPNDVDSDGNQLASKEELEAYLKLLQDKALQDKFGTI